MEMLKLKRLFISLIFIFLIGSNVNAGNNVILTEDAPDAIIENEDKVVVFGSTGINHITLQSGANVEIVNFLGSNTITIQGDSNQFSMSSSGTTVTFEGEDGTRLKFPVTNTMQRIEFNDIALPLRTQIVYGNQVVKTSRSLVDSTRSTSSPDTFTNSFGMSFVRIVPGTYIMGSPDYEPGRYSNEVQKNVTMSEPFYIQTTEVTQQQWVTPRGGVNPSSNSHCGVNCPVENISWEEIQHYIEALNSYGEGTYMLPTEAQWEYAARAGSKTAFANGFIINDEYNCHIDDNLELMGWYCENSDRMTHPVAQKAPNDWGLYDMHGNVREWCQDLYDDYLPNVTTGQMGPNTEFYRVLRGGGYNDYPKSCRSASRIPGSPYSKYGSAGFRLVVVPPQ